jgi:hypothetical protein
MNTVEPMLIYEVFNAIAQWEKRLQVTQVRVLASDIDRRTIEISGFLTVPTEKVTINFNIFPPKPEPDIVECWWGGFVNIWDPVLISVSLRQGQEGGREIANTGGRKIFDVQSNTRWRAEFTQLIPNTINATINNVEGRLNGSFEVSVNEPFLGIDLFNLPVRVISSDVSRIPAEQVYIAPSDAILRIIVLHYPEFGTHTEITDGFVIDGAISGINKSYSLEVITNGRIMSITIPNGYDFSPMQSFYAPASIETNIYPSGNGDIGLLTLSRAIGRYLISPQIEETVMYTIRARSSDRNRDKSFNFYYRLMPRT